MARQTRKNGEPVAGGAAAPANPPLAQDRAEDLYMTFQRYGYAMFPQQRAIYRQLCDRVIGRTVLEAGCGAGLGAGMLARPASFFTATDKEPGNVALAKELYPWVPCEVWDAERHGWRGFQPQVVVCVEVLEHVADPARLLRHLLAAATQEVWLSTPNGAAPTAAGGPKPVPPDNPHHVREYTPAEVLALVLEATGTGLHWEPKIFNWESFAAGPLPQETRADPLVYHLRRVAH